MIKGTISEALLQKQHNNYTYGVFMTLD